MRTIIILLFALSSFSILFGQDTNKVVKDENGNLMLVGPCNREAFSDTSFSWWFDSEYKMYQPDSTVISDLKDHLDNINITVVMGTWCSDSRREVPHFYKIIDEINFPENKIEMFCVDQDKKSPSGGVDSLNIELVPTFIFYKNGKEIGRIKESPDNTLEKDIDAILTKED